jgi:hypothetical protein
MKLKSLLDKYYDCKRINKYKEEKYEYIMVCYKTEDEGI